MGKFIGAACFACWAVFAGAAGPVTVADVVAGHPDRVARLLSALDLASMGIEADLAPADACRAILAYYQTRGTREGADAGREGAVSMADAALASTFTFYDVTGTVPHRPGGGLTWEHRGPVDDREWALALNRHTYLGALVSAWRSTGDAKYARGWNDLVKDWILANPYPAADNNMETWRGLEVHFRVLRWAEGFDALQEAPAFEDATRILLLSSILDHVHYLGNFHKSTSNWLAMEMNGLAAAAVAWPEFKESAVWLDYAIEKLTPELTRQVYPDGVQMELTSHYHWVTLRNFELFAETVRKGGRTLEGAWDETIERMYGYLADSMRPDGFGVLNNDSDRDDNRARVLAAAAAFGREDWRYIASNGAEGTAPAGPPSRVYPVAGQLIMRDGFGEKAQWAFFDAGPMGIGHWHYDKLHLSVAAYGRDVLVDSGRYTYVGGPWREYFRGTTSHNTVLINGAGQMEHAKTGGDISSQFARTEAFDAGYGAFEDGYVDFEGAARHERAVYYQRGAFWLVLDRVTIQRPGTIAVHWHFHPDCTVAAEGLDTVSLDEGKGNVRIVPSGEPHWRRRLARGEETPAILGWYSRSYNIKEPATTAVYETEGVGEFVFAWLILPAEGVPGDGAVTVEKGPTGAFTCRVNAGGRDYSVELRMDTDFAASVR